MASLRRFLAQRPSLLLAATLLLLAGARPTSAAVLFGVDLTGASGEENTQVFNNPSPQFLSVTLSREGLEPAPLTNGFGSMGWAANLISPNYSKYLQIDIVPRAGVSYDITSISFKFALFVDYWVLSMASSVDGFATPQIFPGLDVTSAGVYTFVATPSGVTAQTGPTSFRLYAQSSTGFNPQSTGLISASPAIEFSGNAVPEPASATLLAGSLAMLTFRRRR